MNVNDVESYWKEVGEKLGEPVVAYTLGRYLSGEDEVGPLWGILFVTDTRFFFRHFPQESWFTSLLGSKRNASKKVHIEIPLERSSLEEPEPRTLLQRLLGTGELVYSLIRPGREPLRFTADHTRKLFIDALRKRTAE